MHRNQNLVTKPPSHCGNPSCNSIKHTFFFVTMLIFKETF